MSVRLSTQSSEALVQEHARLVAERARLDAHGRPIEATAVSQKAVRIELELGRRSEVPPAIPKVQSTAHLFEWELAPAALRGNPI